MCVVCVVLKTSVCTPEAHGYGDAFVKGRTAETAFVTGGGSQISRVPQMIYRGNMMR